MYAEVFARFAAHCCAKIFRGEDLEDWEFDAWAAYLLAREMNGHRWLGAMAGDDASTDTVTGRCGLPIARVPGWERLGAGGMTAGRK